MEKIRFVFKHLPLAVEWGLGSWSGSRKMRLETTADIQVRDDERDILAETWQIWELKGLAESDVGSGRKVSTKLDTCYSLHVTSSLNIISPS